MKRLQTYFKLAFSSALLVMASCETNELDLTEDPNFLTPAQASSDFFLNSIQEDFARHIDGDATGDPQDNFQTGGNVNGDGLSVLGMELTRLQAYGSRDYQSGYQDIDTDGSLCLLNQQGLHKIDSGEVDVITS